MAQYSMYCQVVQYMILNKLGKEENSLPIDTLLPMYSFFVEILKIKLPNLLQDWSRWKDYYDNKITIENISNVPIAFFDETRNMNNIGIVCHCNSTAINYLQKIESADWEDNFKRKNTQYQLLITTRSNIPKAYEAFKATITNEFKDQSRIVEDDVYQSLVESFERQGKD